MTLQGANRCVCQTIAGRFKENFAAYTSTSGGHEPSTECAGSHCWRSPQGGVSA